MGLGAGTHGATGYRVRTCSMRLVGADVAVLLVPNTQRWRKSMKIETRPLSSITPYARNPRRNAGAVATVKASLKEYGWQQPIVVDAEGVIIAGHTR